MPNTIRDIGQFIPTGNPDTACVPLTGGPGDLPGTPTTPGSFNPYAPGQMGITLELDDRAYTPVIVDSGCTAATPTGLVAATQLLFWKDKANRIVTNDRRQALGNTVAQGSCNFVAGVARCAVPAASLGSGGAQVWMLIAGYNISVKSGTVTPGELVIADTDANGPQALGVTVGTGPGYVTIGVSRGTNANGATNIDVNIPMLP